MALALLLLASAALATPNADVVADEELIAIGTEIVESLQRAARADRFRSRPQKEQLLRPLDHADALDADNMALLRELLHQLDKALTFFRTEQRRGRDFHIIEEQL